MADMEEMYRAIGRLEAGQQNLALAVERVVVHTAPLPQLVNDVAEMKPEVRHYAAMRQRAVGIGMLLMVAAGSLGAGAREFVAWLRT